MGETDIGDDAGAKLSHSEIELLQFLDTVKPHPKWWEYHLRAEGALSDASWIRLTVEFDLAEGQTTATAVPSFMTTVEVDMMKNRAGEDTGEIDTIKDLATKAASTETRAGWLLRADLLWAECDDPTSKDSLTVTLMEHEGYGKPVVASYFMNREDEPPYYVRAPDLLEPRPEWDCPRYMLAGIFAGDRDKAYFDKLIMDRAWIGDEPTRTEWYQVRWTLPFATAFLLWADDRFEWACNAVRRHDGKSVWIPARWYEEFASRMTNWLKLYAPSELQFSLDASEQAPRARKYRINVIAQCVFVKKRDPVINEIVH